MHLSPTSKLGYLSFKMTPKRVYTINDVNHNISMMVQSVVKVIIVHLNLSW